jgi:ADP-heptose:LPS heptosyltransferase/glycosyltransferase involved in cell wall biosynthesis
MARLTVTVVTLNEEEALPALLESVRAIADEIVVVDSGSTDRTLEIARSAGARVVHRDWPGFREQKAHALGLAGGDYVLNLDADERLTPELAQAIREEMAAPTAAGYRIHFRHRALGRHIRFGAMWRDRRVRLFRRAGARYVGSSVHPRLLVEGPVHSLPGRCDHNGYRDAAEASRKLAGYAEAVARERYRAGRRWRPWDAARWPWGFVKRYLLQLGFLDGPAGLTLARLYAGYDAAKAQWLRTLDRQLGGARARGPIARRLRETGRNFILRIAARLLPTPRALLPQRRAIRRVLVVRTDDRVGNQLLTTPLIRALREGLSEAEIHLLAPERPASAVPRALVQRIIPWNWTTLRRRPWKVLGVVRALRRERYDLVVEAGHWSSFSLTATLLSRLASAGGPVIGHARGQSPYFLSHPVIHNPARQQEVEAKLELLSPLSLPHHGLDLETDLGGDPAAAAAIVGPGERPLAILNPGARMADRRWPPEAHAAVARGLAERGFQVLVVWGPGEERLARAVAIGAGAHVRPAPPTNLEELAALLRAARLCVSNNSGPMHLSVAVGTATVGVFMGPDAGAEAARWGHHLSLFEPATPRTEGDAAAVLSACDRVLDRNRLEQPLAAP